MKISVILTTYNGSEFIIEQLQSIKKQIKKPDEVLIFDDCSSDNTVEIIEEFICKNKLNNWKVEKNNIKKGWKLNFIDGFEKSTGDLIFPCDQDDIWYKNKILDMSNIVENNNNINVLVGNYNIFFQGKDKEKNKKFKNDKKIIKIRCTKNSIYNSRPGCVYCFRKIFFDKYKQFWNKFMPHDELLWKTALLTSSLYLYRESVIDYRRHKNTATKNKSTYKTKLEAILSDYYFFEKINQNNNVFLEKKLIKKFLKFSKLRFDFFEKTNLVNFIKLFRYITYYKTFKSYIGECLLFSLKNKE